MGSLTALVFFAWAGAARVDRVPQLRLDNLPTIHRETPTPLTRVMVPTDDSTLFQRTVWVLTYRVEQMANPHSRVPALLPLVSSTVIGATLQLDF